MEHTGSSSPSAARQPALRGARPPRILEVLYSFRVGGSEVVGLELAHQLARGGAEVFCTAIDGMAGPLRERCGELGLDVVDLQLPITNIFGRNGLSVALVRRLEALNLDALHLQHFVALNKLGLAARLAKIRRVVVTEHSEAQLRDSLAGRVRLRLNWRLAHSITVIHDGIKRYLVEELKIPSSRIAVIPNGIDVSIWQRDDRAQRRRALGIGSEFVFVYVGRLEPVKQVPELISAFLVAQSRLPQPARLLVVGDGSDMAKCRAALSANPFAHTVALLGEQRDTRQYCAAADAFVLNSLSEGTPRALLEAMALGLPAICTGVGGVPEMLHGYGWLTVAGNPKSVVEALLESAQDPLRAQKLGEQARAFVSVNYAACAAVRRYQHQLLDGLQVNPGQVSGGSGPRVVP
jgi:glycosyltransferase involved in cell wall biosynthesis